MTEETDALFESLFALENIRELLRTTAPNHKLDDEQKEKLTKNLEEIKKQLTNIEGLL